MPRSVTDMLTGHQPAGLVGRYGQAHGHPHRIGPPRDARTDRLRRIRRVGQGRGPPGGGGVHDPIRTERAPVLPRQVVGEQIPAAARVDEPIRIHVSRGRRPGAVAVGQAGAFAAPARGGQIEQQRGGDLAVVGVRGVGERAVQLAEPGRDPGRQHLAEFQQRRQGRLVASRDPAERGGAQPDGDREGLLLVKDQRRNAGPWPEVIAAPRTHLRFDAIAELTQPGDVPAHRPLGDLQPGGEIRARPRRPRRQQRQQPQQPRRGVDHGSQSAR